MDSTVTIIPYEDRYHEAFHRLNYLWLDKYNLLEPLDLMVLDDPKKMILDQGGYIWLARMNDEVIGTAALIKEHDNIYELAKMSVATEWQGKGISKLLIETCLHKAKEVGATKVELFSNHQLMAALKLYERYGFQYVEMKDSPFKTADVKMEFYL